MCGGAKVAHPDVANMIAVPMAGGARVFEFAIPRLAG